MTELFFREQNGETRISRSLNIVFLMGKTPQQSLPWLQKVSSTSSPSKRTVYRWFSSTCTKDEPRIRRPNEATNTEIIKKVHRIVLSDRKLKLRELAKTEGISKERVGYSLHDVLEIIKLSAGCRVC